MKATADKPFIAFKNGGYAKPLLNFNFENYWIWGALAVIMLGTAVARNNKTVIVLRATDLQSRLVGMKCKG